MYLIYYLVIGAVILITIFSVIMMNVRKQQQKKAYKHLDVKKESENVAQYLDNFLNSGYSFLKDQMEGDPIEAFTFAFIEHGLKEEAVDQAKNLLKGVATLGTVRFRTVHTSKYLIISNNAVHLLDTDKNGEIDTHLVFDQHRMNNSTLEEMPNMRKEMALGDFALKYYKISFQTDNKPICLIIGNLMADINAMPSYDIQDQIENFVVGNYFLHYLGEKFPNLKVPTEIPFN